MLDYGKRKKEKKIERSFNEGESFSFPLVAFFSFSFSSNRVVGFKRQKMASSASPLEGRQEGKRRMSVGLSFRSVSTVVLFRSLLRENRPKVDSRSSNVT